MRDQDIVLGEHAEELRAIQLIALTLADAAARLSRAALPGCCQVVAAPLLMAAARALSLASCAGLQTPVEVLALSTRNVFEIWLRLTHVMSSDANCQRWRDENLTDQLQVYEAILTLQGPAAAKDAIRDEIAHVTRRAAELGLRRAGNPMMVGELAKGTAEKEDYAAFYKLYSKLVHPSSWSVNSPSAVASPVYRQILVVNAQIYAWRILRAVEEKFDVAVDQSYDAALRQLGGALSESSIDNAT